MRWEQLAVLFSGMTLAVSLLSWLVPREKIRQWAWKVARFCWYCPGVFPPPPMRRKSHFSFEKVQRDVWREQIVAFGRDADLEMKASEISFWCWRIFLLWVLASLISLLVFGL